MQIFHRSTNTISRATIFGAIFVVAAVLWACMEFQRSSYVTYAAVARPQPVPFSHQHHVGDWGLTAAIATPRSRPRALPESRRRRHA